jgi:hypothetical protein
MTAKHTISGRALLILASCGVSLVLVIFAVNYEARSSLDRELIDEAKTAVRTATSSNASITRLKFPYISFGAGPGDPSVMCGYVNGARFYYDAKTKKVTIDRLPGTICSPALYP